MAQSTATIGERIAARLGITVDELNSMYFADGSGVAIANQIADRFGLDLTYSTLADELEAAGVISTEEAEWMHD